MTIREISEKYGISQDTLRYYERVGMIPTVTRTAGGRRDYTKEDEQWVELALCMRSAGLPVEVMIEYVRLFQEGDATIPDRLALLRRQKTVLEEQKRQTEATLKRLEQKIRLYEEAQEDVQRKGERAASVLSRCLTLSPGV